MDYTILFFLLAGGLALGSLIEAVSDSSDDMAGADMPGDGGGSGDDASEGGNDTEGEGGGAGEGGLDALLGPGEGMADESRAEAAAAGEAAPDGADEQSDAPASGAAPESGLDDPADETSDEAAPEDAEMAAAPDRADTGPAASGNDLDAAQGIEGFDTGQDVLVISVDPASVEGALDLDVRPSDDGADGLVFIEQMLVAIVRGAPELSPEDVVVKLAERAA